MDNYIFSLYELNKVVRNTIANSFPDRYWLRAETSDVRQNRNGHCYLEFIQKDEQNRNIIAKVRGTIWANVFHMLKLYFESETNQAFTSGIKVLVQVSVEFHEIYGFSLTVHNIDPSYTLGDQARNRAEILRQLEEEGVLELNKELDFPSVANRIAVISSPTAAGYEDFCNQLANNKAGFVFYPCLFPAVMQGEKAEESILDALDRINEYRDLFDTVVIIRGGGATSELSCFDSYYLAACCAQFPLPVITGIGHERDDTVLDIVSHTRVKTPTAAAEFLINRMEETENYLLVLQDSIIISTQKILQEQSIRLNSLSTHFSYLLRENTSGQLNQLSNIQFRLKNLVENYLKDKKYSLEAKEQYLELTSPENILKKGFSLTLKNNRIVKSSKELQQGDKISSVFRDGKTISIVE